MTWALIARTVWPLRPGAIESNCSVEASTAARIPHFAIEARNDVGSDSSILELVFVANLLGALIAAAGIYRDLRGGWVLGVIISVVSFALYIAQETVGLPGLPQNWAEPSRIVSLVVEAVFFVLAYRVLVAMTADPLRAGTRSSASRLVLVIALVLACTGCTGEPTSTSIPDQTPPTTPSCRSADLELGLDDRLSPPTGQHPTSFTLTNRSARVCYLLGYPGVIGPDDAGRALPFDFRQTGDQVVTSDPPARVELAPGDSAYVTINKYRCDVGDLDLVRTIQLIPPGDDAPLQATFSESSGLGYCGPGDPGSIVDVSPIAATRAATIDYGPQRARAQATRCPLP